MLGQGFVMNLLGNALNHTQSGFIRLPLSRIVKSSGLNHPESTFTHLSIIDTGIGRSHDLLKYKLFTPFSQENPLSVDVGVGLSIVKQMDEYNETTILRLAAHSL
jgi:signal transduction histidine kinase